MVLFQLLLCLFANAATVPKGTTIDGFEAPLSDASRTHPKDFEAAVKRGTALRQARLEAWKRFPNNAIQRTRVLNEEAKKLGLDGVVTLVDEQGTPEYRDKKYPNVQASNWNNTLLLSNKVSLNKAKKILLVVPGQVSTGSHIGSWLPFINEANELSDGEVYVEAFDLPFHGAGPDDKKYFDLNYTAENLFAKRLIELKKRNIPVTIVTRSNGYLPVMKALQKHPHLVTTLYLSSPAFPDKELIARGDLQDVIQVDKPEEKRWTVNVDGWLVASKWEQQADEVVKGEVPKPKSNVLQVKFGKSDAYIPEAERELWRKWVGADNVSEVEKGQHDLFPVSGNKEKARTKERLTEIDCATKLGLIALSKLEAAERRLMLEVDRYTDRMFRRF